MKRTVLFVVAAFVAAHIACAAEPAADIELKNKSSFDVPDKARNPFWPIGWTPAPKNHTNPGEHAAPEITATVFVLSSIAIEHGTRFAIINGKVIQEGQQFGLQIGNQAHQITLKAIEDGQVILQSGEQAIAVPLRRK